MKKTRQQVLAIALGVLAAWALVTGCESTSGTDNLIAVTPSGIDLNGPGASTILTASTATNNLVLPLAWSVDDPALGHIASSVGMTAVYESSGVTGTSTIRVRDQATAEGGAVIFQH